MKSFSITKVVSTNFISDMIAYIQNLIGKNLSNYEQMVKQGTEQCWIEIKTQKINPKWFRFEMTQLTNGAIAILMYGEKK